jgi:hypothetical protein
MQPAYRTATLAGKGFARRAEWGARRLYRGLGNGTEFGGDLGANSDGGRVLLGRNVTGSDGTLIEAVGSSNAFPDHASAVGVWWWWRATATSIPSRPRWALYPRKSWG